MINEPSDPSRRNLLGRTIAIVPAAALFGTAGRCSPPGQNSPTIPVLASVNQVTAYQPTFFHSDEWGFIQAAVARIIPSDSVDPGALETGVPEFIDRQMDAIFGHAAIWYMQGPFVESVPEFGYQSKLAPRDVYRAGIAATNAYCIRTFAGKPFDHISVAQQDSVLTGLESGQITFEGVSSKAFFGFLLQNTKEGYLSDPIHGGNKHAASWVMIGFPGARADYANWIGRPGEHYQLPPVTINGS
jgi:gluconate 2-dehydrogenase gamma chain